MSFAEWNVQSFLDAATVKELIQALKGEKQDVQLDTGMRLQPALQALKNGVSLTEITQQVVEELERYLIAQILESTQGNKAEAARILKVDYKTLYRKMYKYFGTFSDFVIPSNSDEDCSPNDSRREKTLVDPVYDLKTLSN